MAAPVPDRSPCLPPLRRSLRPAREALADEQERTSLEPAVIIRICDVCGAHEDASKPETATSRIFDKDVCNKCFDAEAKRDLCCHKCRTASPAHPVFKPLTRMIVCPTCGNKRCPKASDHDLICTGSNEPGQPGSIYV